MFSSRASIVDGRMCSINLARQVPGMLVLSYFQFQEDQHSPSVWVSVDVLSTVSTCDGSKHVRSLELEETKSPYRIMSEFHVPLLCEHIVRSDSILSTACERHCKALALSSCFTTAVCFHRDQDAALKSSPGLV